jgi:hypothetical protein
MARAPIELESTTKGTKGYMAYLEIALEQLSRGFPTCPTESKHGVRWNQFSNPANNKSLVRVDAESYPNGNVGVVGTRGVGNLCFLDIDCMGLAERIESETGHTLPGTYTVQSSPTRAPYKRHLYFKQTECLLKHFHKRFSYKDTNDRRIDTAGRKYFHELYALKGVGRGDFVVAAGNTFVKDGVPETYTVLVDAPVQEIPDWMVGWLVAEQRKNRSETSKASRAAYEARTTNADAETYPDEQIKAYMKWRVENLVGLLTPKNRKKMSKHVVDWVERESKMLFANGEQFLSEEKNMNKIYDRIKKAPFRKGSGFDPIKVNNDEVAVSDTGALVITNLRPRRPRQVMADSLKGLRTPATSEQVRLRMGEALAEIGVTLTNSANHRKWVHRACKDADLKLMAGQWVRLRHTYSEKIPITTPLSQHTGSGTGTACDT